MTALKHQWPLLFSVAACYPFVHWGLPAIHADKLANVFAAVLNVSAIAAGFLGTTLTVLLAMDEEPVVKALKESETYEELTAYLMAAIRWCFILAVLSCFALFVDYAPPTPFSKTVLTGWAFALLVCALSCYRVIGIFSTILRLRNWGKK